MPATLFAFVSVLVSVTGGVGLAPLSSPMGAETGHGAMKTVVAPADTLEPYVETVSETLSKFEMQPVPGGTVTIETSEGSKTVEVDPFWIAKTEVEWEPYKAFVYGRDGEDAGEGVDAVSRPTNAFAYLAADFGNPREGHPARAMTQKAARHYARWLSELTGHAYRVPTAAQWIHACRSGFEGRNAPPEGTLAKYAWFKGNSEGGTHPVETKAPDANGVHNLLGNLAEWTYSPSDSTRRVVRGGSYQTKRAGVRCTARRKEKTMAWKRTDPQLPKSTWWFADAPFVGLRVVRVPEKN